MRKILLLTHKSTMHLSSCFDLSKNFQTKNMDTYLTNKQTGQNSYTIYTWKIVNEVPTISSFNIENIDEVSIADNVEEYNLN